MDRLFQSRSSLCLDPPPASGNGGPSQFNYASEESTDRLSTSTALLVLFRPREQMRYRSHFGLLDVFASCPARRTCSRSFIVPVETNSPPLDCRGFGRRGPWRHTCFQEREGKSTTPAPQRDDPRKAQKSAKRRQRGDIRAGAATPAQAGDPRTRDGCTLAAKFQWSASESA